jgi:hypothetical protein
MLLLFGMRRKQRHVDQTLSTHSTTHWPQSCQTCLYNHVAGAHLILMSYNLTSHHTKSALFCFAWSLSSLVFILSLRVQRPSLCCWAGTPGGSTTASEIWGPLGCRRAGRFESRPRRSLPPKVFSSLLPPCAPNSVCCDELLKIIFLTFRGIMVFQKETSEKDLIHL